MAAIVWMEPRFLGSILLDGWVSVRNSTTSFGYNLTFPEHLLINYHFIV